MTKIHNNAPIHSNANVQHVDTTTPQQQVQSAVVNAPAIDMQEVRQNKDVSLKKLVAGFLEKNKLYVSLSDRQKVIMADKITHQVETSPFARSLLDKIA